MNDLEEKNGKKNTAILRNEGRNRYPLKFQDGRHYYANKATVDPDTHNFKSQSQSPHVSCTII